MSDRHELVLRALARIDRRDMRLALREILRASASTLGVERVGYWTLSGGQTAGLRCVETYLRSRDQFETAGEMSGSACPRYMAALENEQLIVAADARRDPRLQDLRQSYLEPLGIGAMVDAPVWTAGRLDGVLCHEEVGGPRQWRRDETNFALAAANALAAALEARGRVCAEEAAARSRFLSEATLLLSEELDVESIPARLARLAVPQLADWCVIEVLEHRSIRRLATVHVDPRKESVVNRLVDRFRDGGMPLARPFPPRHLVVENDISDQRLRELAVDEEQLGWLREAGVSSFMLVPLRRRHEPLGLLACVRSQPGYPYDDTLVEVGAELGHRAVIAILNARLYQAAQEAVVKRDEFVSVAAHELNTPLASLRLLVEHMAQIERPLTRERLEQLLPMAHRQVRRLERLVGELLDVTRIDRRQIELSRSQVDLVAVAREVIQQHALEIGRTGSTVELQAVGPVAGHWDRARLEQVVSNLLGNALKFGEGRPITMRVESVDGQGTLAVTDHGIGIAPDRIARIFDRFERAVSVQSYGGLGLGLYIVESLVKAHGGAVQVESRPGLGTTFRVTLPLG